MKYIKTYSSSSVANNNSILPRVYLINNDTSDVHYNNVFLFEGSGTFTSKTESPKTVDGKTYLYKYVGMDELVNFIAPCYSYNHGGYNLDINNFKIPVTGSYPSFYRNKPIKIILNGIEDIAVYEYSVVANGIKYSYDRTSRFVGENFYIYGFIHEYSSGDRCTHSNEFYSNQDFDLNQTLTFQIYVG